ncbi:hypothetical protein GCM10011393_09720 [Sphingopyxis bauzanensis]|nr:hypothetical protein GCM10011393_09720 [Sphingopyxis bauzanensis]
MCVAAIAALFVSEIGASGMRRERRSIGILAQDVGGSPQVNIKPSRHSPDGEVPSHASEIAGFEMSFGSSAG